MTFPIDKTEYEWERGKRAIASGGAMTDDRLLTPERLREWASLHTACDQWDDSPLLPMHGKELQEFCDAWDRDRREIERLREDNITQRKVNRYLKHKISDLNLAKKSLVEERDRLRALLSTVLVDAYEHIGAETTCMVGALKALAATKEQSDD